MTSFMSILLLATIPLRNPFWPVGYHGELEPIVDSVEVKQAADGAAEEEKQKSAAEAAAEMVAAAQAAAAQEEDESVELSRRWVRARKSLRLGSTMKFGDGKGGLRQAVSINGNIYGDGDLVSVNHDGYRFTWRVQTLTNNKTLRLIRVRARELEQSIRTGTGGQSTAAQPNAKDKKGTNK